MKRKKMKTKRLTRAIAAFVLFAFCANPLCYAAYNVTEGANGEIIIGNTKGNSMKSEKEIKKLIKPTEATLTQISAIEEQYINQNSLILMSANLMKSEISEADYKANLDEFGLAYHQNENLPSGSVKINLIDGDYVVLNTKNAKTNENYTLSNASDVIYAGEYHKDGSLMGIIEMRRHNENTYIFYEYRIDALLKSAKIKHVVISYNDEHHASFIYELPNKLRLLQYDGIGYSIDLPLLSGVNQFDLTSLNGKEEPVKQTKQTVTNENAYTHNSTDYEFSWGSFLLDIPKGLVIFPIVMIGLMWESARNK